MYGAILGDIVGNAYKEKELSGQEGLFAQADSVTAVSKGTTDLCVALFDSGKEISEEKLRRVIEKRMERKELEPLTLAMMLTAAGWIFPTISEVKTGAREVAGILCPNFEGIQLAQGVSGAIFYARKGKSKEELLRFLNAESGCEISETETKAKTEKPDLEHEADYVLNAAFRAFWQADDFEAVVREALKAEYCRDKVCVLASALAEAYYGMPDELRKQVRKIAGTDENIKNVLARFDSFFGRVIREEEKKEKDLQEEARGNEPDEAGRDGKLTGQERIERLIALFNEKQDKDSFILLLEALRFQMEQETEVMVPVEFSKEFLEEMEKQQVQTGEIEQLEEENRFRIRTISDPEGNEWCPVFTNDTELQKGSDTSIIEYDLESILEAVADSPKVEGIVFNPFGMSFTLKKEGIRLVLGISD